MSTTMTTTRETGCWARRLHLGQFLLPSSSAKKSSNKTRKNAPQTNPNYVAGVFTKPPLFQSELIAFRPKVNKRGGGRGVFAVKDIQPGTLLMSEVACSSIPDTPADRDPAERFVLHLISPALPQSEAEEILRNVARLHPQSVNDIDSKHCEYLRNRCDRLRPALTSSPRAHALGLDDQDTLVRVVCALHFNGFVTGVYLHLAMVNHSCVPNCVKWGARDGLAHSELRATRYIRAGEEITFSYLVPSLRSREARKRALNGQFQFDCSCQLCTDVDGKFASIFEAGQPGCKPAEVVAAAEALELELERIEEEGGISSSTLSALPPSARASTTEAILTLAALKLAREKAARALHPRHLALAHADMMLTEACLAMLDEEQNPSLDIIDDLLHSAVSLRATQVLYFAVGAHDNETLNRVVRWRESAAKVEGGEEKEAPETRAEAEPTLQHVSSCLMFLLTRSKKEMTAHLFEERACKAFAVDCEGLPAPSLSDGDRAPAFFKDKKEVEACVSACDRAARAIADLYDD